jgi:lipopolysaccharide export system permease protein
MNIIDRYIIKSMIATFIYSILALYIIFIIVTLMENLDDFLDNNVPIDIIFKYYMYYFPEIIKLISPVALLLATLFSVGRLANLNEVTAMKTGGQSLYRMMIPILILSMLISVGQLYFNGWVVPSAIGHKIEIERVHLKKRKRRKSNSIYNIYLRESPQENISIQYYNTKGKYGRGLFLEEFSSKENPRIIHTVEARNFRWDSSLSIWKFERGIIRDFSQDSLRLNSLRLDSLSLERFSKREFALNTTHDRLAGLQKEPEEMNFDELADYIKSMELGGKDVRRMRIDYYGEYAFPFANFIIILFGVPFASVKRKGGMAVQIAASLVISFTYLIFTAIGKTIAYSSPMPEQLVGWLANIIFFVFGIIVLFKTKT